MKPYQSMLERRDRPNGMVIRLAICAALAVLTGEEARAQRYVWTASGTQSAQSIENDLQLTLRVRKSLLQDDRLAQCIVGVTVREGVVRLWGTVPTEELAARAEQRACQVVGVASIRNELHIVPPFEEGEIRPIGPLVQSRLPRPEMNPLRPNSLMEFHGERLARTGGPKDPVTLSWRPAQAENHGIADAQQRTTPVAGKAAEISMVTPPIQVPPAPDFPIARPTTILSSASRPQDVASLLRSIDEIRDREKRFLAVQFWIVDGIVYVISNSGTPAAQFEFAQLVSQLPGVKKVLLTNSINQTH